VAIKPAIPIDSTKAVVRVEKSAAVFIMFTSVIEWDQR
jgi:hypothetical protein